MKLTLDNFEAYTDEGFSFLLKEHGYCAMPVKKGGLWGTAFMRSFVNGDLTISFVFGDIDSHNLCQITFDDGVGSSVDQVMHVGRCFSMLINERRPAYNHMRRKDLTCENQFRSAILEFGALLNEIGLDVIGGDFSAFPTLVFLVINVTERSSSGDVGKPIGIFSSVELANNAIAIRSKSHAKIERSEDFEVWRMDIDNLNLTRSVES